MNVSNEPINTALRDLVARQMSIKWEAFAADHPHLAASIEQVRLIESTVERLTEDPLYRAALDAAGRDDAVIESASVLLGLIETWVDRALGL